MYIKRQKVELGTFTLPGMQLRTLMMMMMMTLKRLQNQKVAVPKCLLLA